MLNHNKLFFFQNRPRVLCLTATLTAAAEKTSLRSLGLNAESVHKIVKNPVNKRISFHNRSGCLNIRPIVKRLREGNCPRLIIFEEGLVGCGDRYLEIKEVVILNH